MKTPKQYIFLWTLTGLLAACGTTTMITGSWRKIDGIHTYASADVGLNGTLLFAIFI